MLLRVFALPALLFTTAFLPPFQPDPPPEPDLSGVYELQGHDGDGKPYSGLAILKKKNDGYLVQWTTQVGGNTVGLGTLDGDKFICAWVRDPVIGQTVYTVSKDRKTFDGRWQSIGVHKWHSETLRFWKAWPKVTGVEKV